MVRGLNADNPLLILLHGGPGSSETALFRSYCAAVEDAYVVVYWDQRGAGRSYRRSVPPASMTIDRFVADLDELIEGLTARYDKRRVVLCGHSWGSLLGVRYVSRFPDKVAAYVGIGQVADMAASEAASYAFALKTARDRGRRKAIKQLLEIGAPPHTIKSLGIQRRWLMALGGAFGPNVSLPELIWRSMTSPESSVLDLVRLLRGSRLSVKLLWRELLETNLLREVPRLETPVIFMLGRLDMQVVASVSAAYFEALEAPHKELIWFEASGHMPPFEEPELFIRSMIATVRPFAC